MYRVHCYNIYRKLQKLIIPYLVYSQQVYADIIKKYANNFPVWLDIGCGHQLFEPSHFDKEVEFVKTSRLSFGLDLDFDSIKNHKTIKYKVRANINNIPFKDSSFDFITANMVVEHLKDTFLQLLEIKRVLKHDGYFIFHTPNLYGYKTIIAKLIPYLLKKRLIYFTQQRREEDVYLTYYKINSASKIKEVSESIGFDVQEINMLTSTADLYMFPPLVLFELFWIKCLTSDKLKYLRTNMVVVFKNRKQ